MSLQQNKVLIVDDEPSLCTVLRIGLAANGFAVEEARDGEEALGTLRERTFDLVLLDINMPGINGLEACQQIRGMLSHAGIVMVSVRDLEDDKIRALEAGADDYVTKPFKLGELTARLRAVLRRTRRETHEPEVLQAGDLKIDFQKRLLWRSEEKIHLSPKEFELLAFMMKHSDSPLTHVKLLRTIWGPEYSRELGYLRAYIKMLRKKIEKDAARPEYILTEPWVGYRFRIPSGPAPQFMMPEKQGSGL